MFTGVTAAGGIERINCHAAAVLSMYGSKKDLRCRFLSLNDPPGNHPVRVGDSAVTVQGFGRNKAEFALSVMTLAPRVRTAYLGHPNFAVFAVLFRFLHPSTRCVVATYGTDVWERLPFFRRLGLHVSQSVTTLSRFTAEKMIQSQKLNANKVMVVPPALDPEFVQGRRVKSAVSTDSMPAKHILLTVARLAASEQMKGVDTVIETLPGIIKTIPNLYYYVVGDGDDRPRLERLAKDVGVDAHVRFVGEKRGVDLMEYYEACEVYVMPSRSEGFGIAFLEAMAFGKPVVACGYGGTPEVVLDGLTGYLVRFGDTKALADRLLELLRNPDVYRNMGEAGRTRVAKEYSFDKFNQGLFNCLQPGN